VRVLLCVRGGAYELPAVVGALSERGAESVVFDSSRFPGVPVSLTYDRSGFSGHWSGDADELNGIASVWQNAVVGMGLPAMAPGVRETCVAAAELALVGLLDNLHVFQLDPRASQARADSKPRQLRVAQQLGLDIPDTIISNDPAAVRAFARRCDGVITKMLVQPASTGPEPGDEVSVVFTTAMTAVDLDQLDGLDLCPMIFQEQIENQLDVRVTVVGKRVFSAAIDAAARGGVDPDWRRDSYAHDRAPVWSPHELPRAVADRVLRLLDHFGLNFGAVDLIVRPDGRHVFLELNACGSFAFLGDRHAGPIAAAIAEVLVDPGARRVASHA
jgi:glutathione synthase/RimK-type ligase-like ATP-grasp enzyme